MGKVTRKQEVQTLGAPRAVQLLHFAADLFAHKNAGYNRQGTTSRYRGFSNFYEARAVRKGMLTPAQYAMTLCDKQDDAAWNALYEGPMSEAKWKDLPERLMDGIVYRAITLALLELDAWDKWKKRQEESLPTKKRDRNKK